MTAPADTYSVASGRPIYGGRAAPATGVPAWIRDQPLYTWALVPGNTLKDIDPEKNPAYNGDYPGLANWHGSNGLISLVNAWCGATFNYETGDMYIGAAGGHADYGGNEVYKCALFSETPNWVMLRPPSGAVGNPITDGGLGVSATISTTGMYSDGRPRPIHTYNALVYIPNKGFAFTNGYSSFPQINGPSWLRCFDEIINDWRLLCDYSALGDCYNFDSGCCYDSLRNCVWELGLGAYNMVRLNVDGTSSKHGTVDNHAQFSTLRYDSVNDLIYIISRSSSSGWKDYPSRMSIFNPKTDLFHILPPSTGALPAGLEISANGTGWDQENGRFILWNRQADKTKVGTLTRQPGDLFTTAWVAGELPVAPSNAVVPTDPTPNNTYGRGDYLAKLGGYVVLNAYDQKIYFFKTKELT